MRTCFICGVRAAFEDPQTHEPLCGNHYNRRPREMVRTPRYPDNQRGVTFRNLVSRYDLKRAHKIMAGVDAATNADIAAWRRLGGR